jgi:predicted dehydrogenase
MNVGIIGYGYTGQQHARAIATIEGVTLKAIAESDEKKRSLADVRSFVDSRSLLADTTIEAVTVCLPHHLHEEVASAALLAGKHVLVEKPLAMSASGGRRLCELAKAPKQVLMVEMTHRFLPPLQEARNLIAAGEIGEIMAINEVLVEDVGIFGSLPGWMLARDTAGGGVALTSGIHLLDHISWISKQELVLKSASFGNTQTLGNVEDTAAFALETETGAPVHILLCWRKQGTHLDGELTVVGSKGTLKVHPWEWIRLESQAKTIARTFFQDGSTIAERALVGIRGAIREFVDSIRQGRFPDPRPEESLASQLIIEQAYDQWHG